ncbi:MAG: energy transducer TonB [Candidatus Acidiferrales bacterium]
MMSSASSPASRVVYNTSLANKLVYPVGKFPRLRRRTLTVTTGPTGGGGLRVYGVLHGGKIYSVYLPMPGKSWVLQYCIASQDGSRSARSRTVAARLDHGLVPPSPREQFDFRRPPVPADKADELIVLHGTIREDGSIGDLRVLRGVDPVADEAALAAFSQWKFDPALRDGKPVLLNILVGVPPTLPGGAGQQAEVPAAERRASEP